MGRDNHGGLVVGPFARPDFFVGDVDKAILPVSKDLAFLENVSKDEGGIFEMQGSIFEVHVVGEDGGFVLFGLKTYLNEFFLDDSAENIVIFVNEINFASGRQRKKIVFLLKSYFHFHEVLLDLGEEQLNLCHVSNHQLYVLVYQLYTLLLNNHGLLNPLQVLLGLY